MKKMTIMYITVCTFCVDFECAVILFDGSKFNFPGENLTVAAEKKKAGNLIVVVVVVAVEVEKATPRECSRGPRDPQGPSEIQKSRTPLQR